MFVLTKQTEEHLRGLARVHSRLLRLLNARTKGRFSGQKEAVNGGTEGGWQSQHGRATGRAAAARKALAFCLAMGGAMDRKRA